MAKIEFNTKISPNLTNERKRGRIKQSVNFEVVDGLNITDLSLTDEALQNILFNLIGPEGKLVTPVKSVLTYAKLKQSDIDLIVLTGGSGKFYLIKETLQKYFDNSVDILEYTETSAVSKGAAIHSYNQTEEGLKKININDLMSDNIYIKREREFDKLVSSRTAPNTKGAYEYKFEKLSNRLEVFLYYGSENEKSYKYKEITGTFKELDKFHDKGDKLTISWELDENKILHIYYDGQILVNTNNESDAERSLINDFVLNEDKV